MISRRQFIQTITLAFAAVAGARNTTISPEVAVPEIAVPPIIPDGLEILHGTQYVDADYYQVTLVWWRDQRLYAKQTVRFTRTILKTMDDLKTVIEKRVSEEVKTFKEQVDFYIANNVPYPPTISYE